MHGKGNKRFLYGMRMLLWGVCTCMLAACASMGRPGGGPRDEEPPRFLRADPAPGATGVKKNRLTLFFDENIQLEDAFNKVVVSPPQKTPPSVSANGRRLTVDLRDTILENTTYTVDFSDAIKDLNEGNILDGFALDFSTGDSIDSLRISGIVLQAENLEPAQGMLVGVYSQFSDTTLTTLPLERIARTNQYGQFTVRNLKPGEYRVFAINDLNRDYHWDRSEDVAFLDFTVSPRVESIELTDTLYASDGADSLVNRTGVRYLPNDILLSWFNENYKAHYLADYKRPVRRQITLNFGAPNNELPEIEIVDAPDSLKNRSFAELSMFKANATRDSILYWLRPELAAVDSLRLAVSFMKTDTNEELAWTTDTLRFFFRDQNKKKKDKKKEKEEPAYTVDSITGDTIFLPPQPEEWLALTLKMSGSQELHRPLRWETSMPLASLDTAGVHFEMLQDTLWTPVPFKILPDSTNVLQGSIIDNKWEPGEKYRLSIDSLAAVSIYDVWNKPFKQEFTVKKPEDYSSLVVKLPGIDTLSVVAELLNSNDVPVYRSPKPAGATSAEFKFLEPGTYYLRLFIDDNGNGKWDTGNIAAGLQPEEVYYFAKKLELKKNWDIEQEWDIYELPVDVQKPYAIKKNKPKLKRGEQEPVEDEDDEDDFYNNPFAPGRNNYGNDPLRYR